MSRNKILQQITIEEMRSRLVSLGLMLKLCLVPATKKASFLTGLSNSVQLSGISSNFSEHNQFERSMILWSCTTGEMINHQALNMYKDKNKSHTMETMMLWGRVEKANYNDSNEVKQNMVKGKLMFPGHHFGIELECGTDIVHCNQSDTYHVPDESINISNWSRVHGLL